MSPAPASHAPGVDRRTAPAHRRRRSGCRSGPAPRPKRSRPRSPSRNTARPARRRRAPARLAPAPRMPGHRRLLATFGAAACRPAIRPRSSPRSPPPRKLRPPRGCAPRVLARAPPPRRRRPRRRTPLGCRSSPRRGRTGSRSMRRCARTRWRRRCRSGSRRSRSAEGPRWPGGARCRPEARTAVLERGFAVVARATPSDRFGESYAALSDARVPYVVTLDSLFWIAHVARDRALAVAEDTVLGPALDALLRRLETRLTADARSAPGDLLAAYALARGVVSVGGRCSARVPRRRPIWRARRRRGAKRIAAHEGPSLSPLLGVTVDYSQIVPRGAADASAARAANARAVAWLGAAPFVLAARGGDRRGAASRRSRSAGARAGGAARSRGWWSSTSMPRRRSRCVAGRRSPSSPAARATT